MEEIQGKQERQQNQQRSELENEEEGNKARVAEPPSSSLGGRAAPRSGALLVEVYGRVVRKQHNCFSPNQVLLDFTKYLVSFPIHRNFIFVFQTNVTGNGDTHT